VCFVGEKQRALSVESSVRCQLNAACIPVVSVTSVVGARTELEGAVALAGVIEQRGRGVEQRHAAQAGEEVEPAWRAPCAQCAD
jgi:hypothetical protein